MTRPPILRLRSIATAATLALAASLLVSVAATTASDDDHAICHATGSATNPYILISPDKAGVHDGHLGEGHQDGDDIVPPFTYHGEVHSQNWDAAGQAIFDDCAPEPGTSTSTSETNTTTASETTTTGSDTNTTTTQIPVFGSGTAVALGVGGSVLGTLLMLRRRL